MHQRHVRTLRKAYFAGATRHFPRAPINSQNVKLLAHAQNAIPSPRNLACSRHVGAFGAFLRLKRWAIIIHPSGMKTKSWWHWTFLSAVLPTFLSAALRKHPQPAKTFSVVYQTNQGSEEMYYV